MCPSWFFFRFLDLVDSPCHTSGICEATLSSAVARTSGWWHGWKTQTPQCQMSSAPAPVAWRASVSMTFLFLPASASQQVKWWVHYQTQLWVVTGLAKDVMYKKRREKKKGRKKSIKLFNNSTGHNHALFCTQTHIDSRPANVCFWKQPHMQYVCTQTH